MSPPHVETKTTENIVGTDVPKFPLCCQSFRTYMPQAGAFCYEANGQNVNKQEVVQFHDQNPSFTCAVASEQDDTYNMVEENDCTMAEFLSRPFMGTRLDWNVSGATVSQIIYPWKLFMQNPRIVNRICNYRNLRCNLHVKVLLNGNNFYFGRAMMSYLPYCPGSFHQTRNSPLVPPLDTTTASQRPKIFLDPGTSQGGEMVLPFFYPFNAIDVPTFTPTNMEEMGRLWIQGLTPLAHTNGGTNPITISVYIWASDVHLSGPTLAEPTSLTPQSGEVGAEYGIGVVSKPASIVEKLSGSLANAPIIGKYAMATSIAAGAVGRVASLFGFSRPAVVSTPILNKPTLIGNMVNVDAPDQCARLSAMSKQEVTIDPRTVALQGVDELEIRHIAEIESLMGSFQWAPGTAEGTLLASFPVHPTYQRSAPGPPVEYALSACQFASRPFRYWRGNMAFRFQIVASGYHKGRLKFVYDPFSGSTSPEDNTTYTRIVDIAEERDFTITCGWTNPAPGLNTQALVRNFDTSAVANDPGVSNGVLTVYVLNELVGPSATTDPIYLLPFVSCRDLDVWSPTEERLEGISFFPPPETPPLVAQAGIIQSDENTAEMPLNPAHAMSDIEVALPKDDPSIQVFTSGEAISSLRQIMRRYSYHTLLGGNTSGTFQFGGIKFTRSAFPYWYGADPDAPVDDLYNLCKLTTVNWVTSAFAGYRGSMRWKITPLAVCAADCDGTLMAARCPGDCTYGYGIYGGTPSGVDIDVTNYELRSAYVPDMPHGLEGVTATTTRNNGVLEFEIPWYSRRRFNVVISNVNDSPAIGYGWYLYVSSLNWSLYHTWVATGEDFNTFFFLGCPILYDQPFPAP